jgi:hypothetical protein
MGQVARCPRLGADLEVGVSHVIPWVTVSTPCGHDASSSTSSSPTAPTALTSSELMCLSFRDGRYRIWYRDTGQDSELCLTEDPHEAERVFVREVRRLVEARYPRRRWPKDEQA